MHVILDPKFNMCTTLTWLDKQIHCSMQTFVAELFTVDMRIENFAIRV